MTNVEFTAMELKRIEGEMERVFIAFRNPSEHPPSTYVRLRAIRGWCAAIERVIDGTSTLSLGD